jgi:short-subunit dehydrogenase
MSQKVGVVIGAGPGLGVAVARRFGREGFQIALVARRQETLSKFVEDFSAAGISARAFAADAGNAESLRQVLSEIKVTMGAPEVLVYNAAVVGTSTPSTVPVDKVMDELRVNVGGALVSAQQVIPDMKAAGRGTILFTGGGLALYPSAAYASLAIGKAAIRSLAYSLGQELQDSGIYVGTVTVAGSVQPGTYFDPDTIAEVYWRLHQERNEREVVYRQQ